MSIGRVADAGWTLDVHDPRFGRDWRTVASKHTGYGCMRHARVHFWIGGGGYPSFRVFRPDGTLYKYSVGIGTGLRMVWTEGGGETREELAAIANHATREERAMSTHTQIAPHTSGPWRMTEDAGHPANVRVTSTGRRHIAKVYALSLDRDLVAEANARLICAAPELLFALRSIVNDLPERRDWLNPDIERLARAAIAAAQESEG